MKEHKPVILINLCTKTGDDMFYLRRSYVEAIMHAGGIPVALPLVADRDYSARVAEFADGILLPGSITDVDPKYYSEEVTPHFGQKGPERDQSDFFLLEKAFDRKLPVFGICYGHQSLNVFCGGALYQDIPHDLQSSITHWQQEPYNHPVHSVKVEEDSIIFRLFGKKEIEVNSIHHQGVKRVAPNLRATCISPDGVIESYENKNGGQFLMGVQWHPERMWQDYPSQAALFQEFVGAARKWHIDNR
jgi:putative glutamine amidotransferase